MHQRSRNISIRCSWWLAGRRWLWVGVYLLLLTGCGMRFPGLGTATPQPFPTPVGDTLPFSIPTYNVELLPGGRVPGTQLIYVRQRETNAYEVTIDGQAVLKQPGDSFLWQGIIAPGVFGRYNLRLQPIFLSNLQAAGNVDITIFNPEPVELTAFNLTPGVVYFPAAPVAWRVLPQTVIPGTNFVYMGAEGEVIQLARLGDVALPPFAAGDSLVWQGRLRQNVLVRFDLALQTPEADGVLPVRGSATLWLQPAVLAP